MRILHVITTLDTGGAERLMVDLLPLLKDKGNQVELLLFNGVITPFKQELEQKGVTIYELTNKTGNVRHTEVYDPMNIYRLHRFIKDFDIIHTHNTACQLYVPIARTIFKSNVKLVTTEHNTTNRRRSTSLFKPIDKWMYHQYSSVICIGDSTSDNLKQYLGSDCHTCVIYNGVDTHKFIHPIRDISERSNYTITMVAGFRPQKDQDTLIRAIKHLPSNYRLRLVGEGEREAYLKKMCHELNLDDRISFMGARMDVPQILEQSDVVVLSSHWEGLSLSSIEGMASGRPFVASDVDGLRDIVRGAGMLFPHGDDLVLARSIQELCENPELYRNVAMACQERAKDYDISIMADRYNQLYKDLMQKK